MYTGLRSPIASTQWRIIGWFTGSAPTSGSPTSIPSNALSFARNAAFSASRLRHRTSVPYRASLACRAMPRPAVATISRSTSTTPPPNVLICAARAARSTSPWSTAPGEPAAR